MRLVQIFNVVDDNMGVVFEVIGDTTTAHRGKQYITVSLHEMDEEHPSRLFKKKLVVEYLTRVAHTRECLDWRELDTEIAAIMNAKIHSI